MAPSEHEQTLREIQQHLKRLGAQDVRVELTDEFEPKAGTLARVDYQGAYWHLLPQRLLDLLRDLPSGSGGSGIRETIGREGHGVWHGPSPSEARDTLT